jgi:hypothetical protein
MLLSQTTPAPSFWRAGFPQLPLKVRKAGGDQYCAIAARLIVTCPPSTLMTSKPGTMTLRPKLALLLNYEGTHCYPEEVEPLKKKTDAIHTLTPHPFLTKHVPSSSVPTPGRLHSSSPERFSGSVPGIRPSVMLHSVYSIGMNREKKHASSV